MMPDKEKLELLTLVHIMLPDGMVWGKPVTFWLDYYELDPSTENKELSDLEQEISRLRKKLGLPFSNYFRVCNTITAT